MRKTALALVLGLSAFSVSPASAATFIVDAEANSSSGSGVALPSIALTAGQIFTVSSSLNDLWRAGALPRYSDGRGIFEFRQKTAADDAPEAIGTVIEANIFGQHTQHGLTANFGALVGEIGGVYQTLGANFSGPAWGTGTLNLYYWDSNSADNDGAITFNIAAVPEPATWAMMIIGFGLIGGSLRRARRSGRAAPALVAA